MVSEPHPFLLSISSSSRRRHAHAERLVDDLGLGQALERQADLHRAAGHGERQRRLGQLDAALGRHAARARRPPAPARAGGSPRSARAAPGGGSRAPRTRRTPPASRRRDRAARWCRPRCGRAPRRRRPRAAPPSAPPPPPRAARRRRRTGPPWRRSSSRPRPSCSPPPPRSGRATWRGSRPRTNARSAAAIRSSRVCSRRSARVRRSRCHTVGILIPTVSEMQLSRRSRPARTANGRALRVLDQREAAAVGHVDRAEERRCRRRPAPSAIVASTSSTAK